MAANVRIIQAREFLRAQPDGHADLASAERLLNEIVAAAAGRDDYDVLIDTRNVSGALSATELWTLAERMVRFRQTFARRTAILCPLEKFDHTRFFALCAENRGFNIEAFSSYEDAMEWLIEG